MNENIKGNMDRGKSNDPAIKRCKSGMSVPKTRKLASHRLTAMTRGL